jgi:hypothetical protein
MGNFISDFLGTTAINQNFNYDPALSDVSGTNAGLDSAITNVSGAGNRLLSQAGSTFTQGQSFLNPNSDYYKNQRGFLNEDITASINEQNRAMNAQLAARGIGAGGIRSMLGAVNTNQIGEQVRRGTNDLFQQGQSLGAQLMSSGMQGTQGAGSLYTQAGNLSGDIQNRLLQQATFNAQQKNNQEQYTRTSNYNQKLSNIERKGQFANQILGIGASFIPNPFKKA